MARYWIDPPQGYLYGFPKAWDDETDGTMDEFLKKNNYPDEHNSWIRMWEYKEEEQSEEVTNTKPSVHD